MKRREDSSHSDTSVRHTETDTTLLFMGFPPHKPRLLIPPAHPRVQAMAFGLYSPGSIKGKILKYLGKSAASLGLMKMAAPFIARPPSMLDVTDRVKPIFNGYLLEQLRNAWEQALNSAPLTFAISLGDPNYYQKVTALVFDQDSEPRAFAKIGCTNQSKCLIENERVALEALKSHPGTRFITPDLLGHGETGNASWILQSPLLEGRPAGMALQKHHFAFLGEMAHLMKKPAVPDVSPLWSHMSETVNTPVLPIKAGFEAERPFIEALAQRFKSVDAGGSHKSWPMTAAHGDFAPWNMRVINGRIALFDWEYFMPEAPAGWDVFHYIARVAHLIHGKPLERIWEGSEDDACRAALVSWADETGLELPDFETMKMLVLLSIALDLVPRMICRRHRE